MVDEDQDQGLDSEGVEMINAESVLVIREHKLAFLHIPECAGTSVKHALAQALGYHGFGYLKRMRQMWDMDRVLVEGRDCFEFSIVRNPFDRLVSAWEHNVKGNGPGTGRIGFEPDIPFSQFASAICRIKKDGYLDIHVRPMASTLVRSGQMVPDMVLRFESLMEDWGASYRMW